VSAAYPHRLAASLARDCARAKADGLDLTAQRMIVTEVQRAAGDAVLVALVDQRNVAVAFTRAVLRLLPLCAMSNGRGRGRFCAGEAPELWCSTCRARHVLDYCSESED
jgi:hypothetical protein